MTFSREQAWAIVCGHVQSESLRRHMLAVEAAMRWYAAQSGADQDAWGLPGLLHDYDWEIHPTLEEHPQAGQALLRAAGVPEDVLRCIMSHAHHTNLARETPREQALFACDELTGLITACALVRPSRALHDLTTKSVRGKWKDKAFAAGVNRADIEQGAREMNVELWQHVGNVISALQPVAAELGLTGA